MSRPVAAVCLILVVVAGLAIQFFRDQPWADAAGSVAYAMAACFAINVLWRGRPLAVAAVAFGACVLVELAQLTGIPERLPALRLVLGTTFTPVDIAGYAVGCVLGCGILWVAGGRGVRDE